jgi:ABC-type phosphate transport system substrate-binding protein
VDTISKDNTNINDLIQKQMKNLFDNEYKDKFSELQTSQNELEDKKQHIAVLDEMKAAGMDSSLIDFVYDKDIEASKLKIKQLKGLIDTEVQKGVEARMKNNYIPPTNHEYTKLQWF